MDLPQKPNADRTFVILGTAPTWKLAPWDNPDAVIAGLNDAYLLGLPRFDVWYDIHPFNRFFFRGAKKIDASQVPAGTFVRPEGHIQWLAKQACPVFLHQPDPRVPHGQVFPRAEIEAQFGTWFDSSPQWMLAHAILQGFKRVEIYGIHLASQEEYVKQKPAMCWMIGVAQGLGVQVHVPKESPLMQGSHKYAYELDPAIPVMQIQRNAQRLEAELQLLESKWQASRTFVRRDGDPFLRQRLAWVKAQLLDLHQAAEWETLKKRALVGVA